MTDTNELVTDAEIVEPAPPGGLDLGALAPMLGMFGIDADAVGAMLGGLAGDPDAIDLDDLAIMLGEMDERLSTVAAQLDQLTGRLLPLLDGLAANAGKLKRFGIDLG